MQHPATEVIELLSVKAVARFLDRSEGTVRNWDRRGKLVPFARLQNGMRVYRRDAIDQLRGQLVDAAR